MNSALKSWVVRASQSRDMREVSSIRISTFIDWVAKKNSRIKLNFAFRRIFSRLREAKYLHTQLIIRSEIFEMKMCSEIPKVIKTTFHGSFLEFIFGPGWIHLATMFICLFFFAFNSNSNFAQLPSARLASIRWRRPSWIADQSCSRLIVQPTLQHLPRLRNFE